MIQGNSWAKENAGFLRVVMNDRVRTNCIGDLSITSACNVVVLKCCRYKVEGADESRSDLTEATMSQSCGDC